MRHIGRAGLVWPALCCIPGAAFGQRQPRLPSSPESTVVAAGSVATPATAAGSSQEWSAKRSAVTPAAGGSSASNSTVSQAALTTACPVVAPSPAPVAGVSSSLRRPRLGIPTPLLARSTIRPAPRPARRWSRPSCRSRRSPRNRARCLASFSIFGLCNAEIGYALPVNGVSGLQIGPTGEVNPDFGTGFRVGLIMRRSAIPRWWTPPTRSWTAIRKQHRGHRAQLICSVVLHPARWLRLRPSSRQC